MNSLNIKTISWIIVIFICACSAPPIKDRHQNATATSAEQNASYFDAARNGDISIVMRLIEEKLVDVNMTDAYRWTGLTYAIQHGHEGLAEYFLIRKANINHQDKDGLTPLMIAVNERHPGIVELLLQSGADPVKQDKYGYTALMWAIYNNSRDSVPLLMTTRRGLDLQNVFGDTALHLALDYRHYDFATMLISHNANVNIKNQKKEHRCIWRRKRETKPMPGS